MLTVPEAARRANRNPETIRRWIRAGKLPARKIGTQHVIEEGDLDAVLDDEYEMAPLPPELALMEDGRPQLNWVRIIRQARESR
jgi:excisionase family DNA binding protein